MKNGHEEIGLNACHLRFFATKRYIFSARPIRVLPRATPPFLAYAWRASRNLQIHFATSPHPQGTIDLRNRVIGTAHNLVDTSAVACSKATPLPSPAPHEVAPPRVAKLCTLEYALGRPAPCPAEACPFWEPGGAVVEAGCMLERFLAPEDWPPDLAAHWLRVRELAQKQRV